MHCCLCSGTVGVRVPWRLFFAAGLVVLGERKGLCFGVCVFELFERVFIERCESC